jgi:hypothetical protein
MAKTGFLIAWNVFLNRFRPTFKWGSAKCGEMLYNKPTGWLANAAYSPWIEGNLQLKPDLEGFTFFARELYLAGWIKTSPVNRNCKIITFEVEI